MQNFLKEFVAKADPEYIALLLEELLSEKDNRYYRFNDTFRIVFEKDNGDVCKLTVSEDYKSLMTLKDIPPTENKQKLLCKLVLEKY